MMKMEDFRKMVTLTNDGKPTVQYPKDFIMEVLKDCEKAEKLVNAKGVEYHGMSFKDMPERMRLYAALINVRANLVEFEKRLKQTDLEFESLQESIYASYSALDDAYDIFKVKFRIAEGVMECIQYRDQNPRSLESIIIEYLTLLEKASKITSTVSKTKIDKLKTILNYKSEFEAFESIGKPECFLYIDAYLMFHAMDDHRSKFGMLIAMMEYIYDGDFHPWLNGVDDDAPTRIYRVIEFAIEKLLKKFEENMRVKERIMEEDGAR